MRGLSLAVVDHGPALSRLDGERLGVAVAELGHAVHESRVNEGWSRFSVRWASLGRPSDHGEPFSTWSLAKLADHLVRKGVVDDTSHEGLQALLCEEGVSFQAIKTWKQSNDPDFELKKNRILELYEIADGRAQPRADDPDVVICHDEFGPINL